MSFPTELPYKYTMDKTSPYYQELIPRPMFEAIWAKAKPMAIGYLSQLDPSHATLYQTEFPKIYPELDKEWFKESCYEMFVGCHDMESPCFKLTMRGLVAKMASWGRFSMERMMYKNEIDSIKIKNPLYIVALPRSGTTFTHTSLACDPKARTILYYQHFSSGSKTMSLEGRKAFGQAITGSVIDNAKEINAVHNIDNLMVPEEELFFMEMLSCTYVFGTTIPRWEQYRESAFTRNWDDVYYAVLDHMRMTAIEYPMTDDMHFLLKSVNHFMSPIQFFRIMCSDEIEPRIVWMHREPIAEIKSCFYLFLNARGRYPNEKGENDMKWLQEKIIEMNCICLKNALYCRRKWIEEKPERQNQIFDCYFKDMIDHPDEIAEKIYKKWGMEITDDIKKEMLKTKDENHPQKQHGRKVTNNDDFFFDEEKVKEMFKFYYDEFKEYLPNW